MKTFYPGDRVIVWDHISRTWRSSTVIRWYGKRASKLVGGYPYPSLIDVKFDGTETISCAHFTDGVKYINGML